MMREDVADYQTFLITDTSDEASSSYENIVTRDHSSNSTNSDQTLEWVKKTFCKKCCIKYIPLIDDEESCRCHCGRTRQEHRLSNLGESSTDGAHASSSQKESDDECNEKTTWIPMLHLRNKETNAFGNLVFNVAGKQARAKYIRLHAEADVNDAIDLLLKHWNLSQPELLISIIGDDKITELNPKLASVISQGLTQTVNSTGAWIITNGAHTGTLNFFNQKTVCIGITKWGTVFNRKELTNLGETVNYNSFNRFTSDHEEEVGVSLKECHTHFLLVDDGYTNRYEEEIQFRTKLEDRLRNCKDQEDQPFGVHNVRLLLGGGPFTIDFILAELKKKTPVPVIVITGSGKAAKILAYAHRIHQADKPLFEMDDVSGYEELRELIKREFPYLDNDDIRKIYSSVLECMNFKDHIFTYVMKREDEKKDLDAIILESLLQDKNLDQMGKVNLAMIFNRADIARNSIFIAGVENRLKWTENQMKEFLFKILVKNKPDFLSLFFEIGVRIDLFIAGEDFYLDLYKEALKKDNSFLKIYMEEKKIIEVDDGLLRSIYHECMGKVVEKEVVRKNMGDFHKLFIWAVMNNLPDMMYLLWSHGEDFLLKSLTGQCTLNLMIEIGGKHGMSDTVISQCKTQKTRYNELGLRLLQECYKEDEKLTRQLLMNDCNAYTFTFEKVSRPSRSLHMSIASEIYNEEFIGHISCQQLLNLDWYGPLDWEKSGKLKFYLKFLLCMLIPLLTLHPSFMGMKIEANKKIEDNNEDDNLADFGTTENICLHVTDKGTMKRKKCEVRILAFLNAPISKFYYDVVNYTLFLILFTLLISKPLTEFSTLEWILNYFVAQLALAELQKMRINGCKKWISNPWNICDAIAIVLFFVGFGLRYSGIISLIRCRIIYVTDLMLFIVRILEIFYVDRILGPYVVMIGRMMTDLIKFLIIALVFMLAYGVGRDVILNPDADHSWSRFFTRLFVPYFQMYGELFIEYPQQNANETIFSTDKYNESVELPVTLMMAVYLLIANVLLLNILIAKFNNTYTEVQQKADSIWKFQYYHLVKDYQRRIPSLILSIYSSLISFCIFYPILIRSIRLVCHKDDTTTEWTVKDQKLLLFEERCLNKMLKTKYATLDGTIEEEVALISEEVILISDRAKEINIASANNRQAICNLEESFKILQNNLQNIESLLKEVISNQNSIREYRDLTETQVDGSISKESIPKASTKWNEKPDDGDILPDEKVITDLMSGTQNKNTELPASSQKGTEVITPTFVNVYSTEPIIFASHEEEYQNALSKSKFYPMSNVKRSTVPDHMVSWKVDMSMYNPPNYTSPAITASCKSSKWSDEEIVTGNSSSFKFNNVDGEVDRRSYMDDYQIVNGIPRNPVGRTGLVGRGILSRYGPNHIYTALFTRTQLTDGKSFNEALVMPKKITNGLVFPQGTKAKDSEFPRLISNLFSKDTLMNVGMDKEQSKIYTKRLKEIITNKVKIFEGYLDDERNTDNAWLETIVYNYHDDQNVVHKYLLSNESLNLHWRKISEIQKDGSGLQVQLRDWLRKSSAIRK